MIHKILGRLASARSFVFAALALASFAASAFETPYLTFRSAETFSIRVSSPKWDGTMQYSTDAANWTTWTGAEISAAQSGDEYFLYLRGTGNSVVSNGSWTFSGSGDLVCEGDIETLRDYNGNPPAMGEKCYYLMFSACERLTSPPVLSATTLAASCYSSMFSNCTALKSIPALPATGTLPAQCYFNMCGGCSSLVVNTVGPGVEWSIPSGTTGGSIWNWYIFNGTGGDFTGNPVAGTTYYVASALPPGLRLETAEVHVYTGESMHIDLADAIAGGTGEYTFTDTASALSALGLSLSGNTLSGTISTAGNYNFTLHVADTTSPDPLTLDAEYTLVVTDPDPLAATANLGVAKIGKTVNIALADTISGGVPPYTFVVTTDETLPVGFSLTDGVLSGTASVVGTLTFKITAKDALETSLPVSYTLEAVESTGFSDDDPEEPASGVTVNCLTLDGVFPRTCNQISDSSTAVTWDNSWYYVTGNITLSAGAVVNGKVSLILGDGAMLTVSQGTSGKAGINVSEGNSLVIYGQSAGSVIGKLKVTNNAMYGAGIGGDQNQNAGKITIFGGDVDSNSGFWGAALGGGNGGNGGTITINGGTVTAAGYYGPGIGAGKDGNDGTVIVNGGTVNASCSNSASYPGISDKVTLTVGANVVVKAGTSATLTDSDIKNPGGETSIPLTTKYQYYLIEKQGPASLTQDTSAFVAHVGEAFNQSIAGTVSGGTSPYTFTLKSQTLSEKGLSYSDGVISGTPTATGSATVTVTVSDSATGADHQSEDFTYTVTITYPPKSITYIDSSDGTTELTGLEPAEYTPGTATPLPATATAPSGYAFAGWYATKECTGDAVTSVATTETEDKTYYAKWTPILYTITYRDGASTMSGLLPTTYTIESTDITIPTPATKTGYEFVSWHTSSLLTPASVVTTIPHGSTGNKTFYSKWSLVPVNAPYKDGNGNTAYVSSTPLETTSTSLSTGWYIATGSITIPSTVTVSGDVKLILEDGCSLTVNGSSSKAGINVAAGNSLTIYAQENGTGSLTAIGGSDGAGIGGDQSQTCGSVTIYGGNVTARSLSTSTYGAGIGGGKDGAGGTVTIYGGTVVAQVQNSSGRAAGIGGGGSLTVGASNGGTVTIYGGTVTATATYYGAGIGGGYYGNGGTVTIYGGTVTATSSSSGAGIGGGNYGAGGNVTINGGTVTATAGSATSSTTGYIASGIGKGYGSVSSYGYGTLTVGANMKAYAGSSANPTDELGTNRSYRYYLVKAAPLAQSVSAINAGAGEHCNIDLSATVLGGSGTYTFELKEGSELPSGLEINGTALSGTVANVGTYEFTLVVTDTTAPTPQTIDAEYTLTVKLPGFIDDDPTQPASGVEVDCKTADGVVRRRTCNAVASSSTAVTWENSWYYVTGNVTLSAGVTVVGKVSLVLADDATLTVTQSTANNAGINVSVDNSLVIYGQTKGNGALNASAGPDGTTSGYYGAGIGGNKGASGNTTGKCGTIVIYGGNITAQGSYYGAGIGGGYYGAGGTINIYGGTVNATGGYYGSGIGGGYYAAGGTVNVYGGAFEATAGSASYAIGVGRGGGSSSYVSGNFYVFNEDMTVKAGSSATASLTKLTPNATTHKVTVSTYKYFIVTGPLPMSQRTASLGTARTGELKSWTLATSTSTSYIQDGKPPYTFDPENSTIPEGFSLTSAGVLSGRPSSAGNYEFDIAVTDSNPSSTNFTFTLTVSDPNPITMSTGLDLGTRTKGQSYTKTLSASGGVPSLTYAVVDGTFPPGLNLGTGGYISGSTTTAGDYNFTVRVTDSALPANTADFEFHMFVKDVYAITYYDTDGETISSLQPATYVETEGVASLPTPVKDGFRFFNWYDNADFYGAPVTEIPTTSKGLINLYAKWYVPVSGDIQVTFTGADGEQTETCTVITPSMAAYDSAVHYNNTSSNITLSSGWYVVANIDTLPQKVSIVINGEVNLVLMDDRSLTVTKPAYHKSSDYLSAIVLTSGNTLNIYGQTKGTGTLTANGFNGGAGIGGCGNLLTNGIAADGGTVKIYGGTVTATGSAFSYSGPRVGAGAGIGGGGGAGQGGSGGTVEIYGGNVTAIGGVNESASAAGIGGGNGADSEGTLKVSGQYAVVYAGDDASSATERTPGANDMVALDGSPYYEIQGEGAAPVTYNITYMSAGVEQTWLEPNNYTHGTAQTLATPDPREGYTFDGWFDNDQCLGVPVSEISANATGDKTFYAKWTPVVYTITYYSIVGDEKTEITSLAPAIYTTESGATLPTEISVVREGWMFDGWASYTSGPPITGIEPGTTGNKTFYVRWDVSDFGLFDGEIYLDACFEDEVDLADTIHKGTAPYTFALKAGEELPTGLTLESDGTLSGTPTAAGIYEVMVTVTDSSEPKRSIDATYTIEVMLSKTTGISGADATVAIGFPVEIDLAPAIRGGTAPYSFEVATNLEGNALPSGLVLNGNTLEGTSTMRGNAFFALNVTDSKGYSSYLYYTIYSQSDSAQRTDTVNGIEWGYVSSSLPKQAGRLSIWNSSSLASDGMHAISANTEGCVYVPDGSCLWTGREPVTCIGRNAFKNCDKITRVTLPATITDIGENAFDGCTALKAVVIPSSDILEHINTNAFAGATSLEHIYVGKGDKVAFTALLEASGYTVPNENFILECDFYKLTLDTNLGDELDMPVLTKAYTETIYLPNVGNLPVPTRKDYTFEGWYTERSGGTRINEDDTLSGGDWTLYAHWSTTMPDPVFTVNWKGEITDVALNGHTEVVVPETVNDITVTAIGNSAFDGRTATDKKKLLRVALPDSIKNIDSSAFAECTNLREVNIPSGVTNIALQAFRLCVSLESVDIPGSVETIGSSAFANCSNLVSVTIGDGVRNIGQGAFGYCTSLSCDDEQGFYIPDSVQTIGSGAFHSVAFTKASLPGSLYSVGSPVSSAFSNVSLLKSVDVIYRTDQTTFVIQEGRLTRVYLNGNTEVVVPNDVTNIWTGAFRDLSEMTSVTIPNTVTEIHGGAFENCTGLTEINLPDSLLRLGHAFTGCTNLKNIVIPDSVTELEEGCFGLYDFLETVTIGSGVTVIPHSAFYHCSNLEAVTVRGNVTSIARAAFSDCTSLQAIELPDTLKEIGNMAFYNCASLSSLRIPKGVAIGSFAFAHCSSLTSVNISGTVVPKLLKSAKAGRRLLTAGPDPEATSVGQHAFYSCSGLDSVLIGSKVNEIGGGAFGGCSKLKSITVEAGNENYTTVDGMLLTADHTTLISGAGSDRGVVVPANVTSIEEGAFAGFGNITSVTLPNTVQSVGTAAFSNCTALATMTIPSSVTSIGNKAFYGTAVKTVCVSPGDATRMSGLVAGTGYDTTGVTFFDPTATLPTVDKPFEEASNGLPNWQNYVLNQDADEPVKVEGVSNETDTTVSIASTLKTPAADTGFTVKYSIDKVSANGALVSEGEKQATSAFSIDLESITTNAFFTMKATIINDETGAEIPVETENTIGVLAITDAPKTTVIGVPFKSLSEDGSISVANLVHTANLTDGAKLSAYDSLGNLHAWTLEGGVWTPDVVVGQQEQTGDASTIKLDRGKGVWLTRADEDLDKPIYLIGEASNEPVETELEAPAEENGTAWTLVASPSVEPVDVADIAGANTGDRIILPSDGFPRNYSYKNGEWGYDGNDEPEEIAPGITVVRPKRITGDNKIPAGRGFWYLNKDAGSKSINW